MRKRTKNLRELKALLVFLSVVVVICTIVFVCIHESTNVNIKSSVDSKIEDFYNPNYKYDLLEYNHQYEGNRFGKLEENLPYGFIIYVDKETRVMYLCCWQEYGASVGTGITIMYDKNGKPLCYNGDLNKLW